MKINNDNVICLPLRMIEWEIVVVQSTLQVQEQANNNNKDYAVDNNNNTFLISFFFQG